MPATTNGQAPFDAIRRQRHPDCWVCSPSNGKGLALNFVSDDAGAVEGLTVCGEDLMGYPGYLHGGITSALLDGAMTNCLLARGTPGLTARLEIRFLKPVLIGREIKVRGWWEKSRGALHFLCAELLQDEEVLATAKGKFMDFPDPKDSQKPGDGHEKNRHHHL